MDNIFREKKSNLSSLYKKIKKILTLNFYRLTKVLYYSNSDIFELETCSFFIKQVRILPEIEKLCYQGARPAKFRTCLHLVSKCPEFGFMKICGSSSKKTELSKVMAKISFKISEDEFLPPCQNRHKSKTLTMHGQGI